jgi:predicted transcriptional regulator
MAVKTLRLDPELEGRLQRAAAVVGESLSEFIRQAAAERANTVLNVGEREYFADVVGAIHGGGGRARRTGDAFADILSDRTRSRKS